MKHSHALTGMTCTNCETSVKQLLSQVEGVSKVETSLAEQRADVETSKQVPLNVLREALKPKLHYQINELGNPPMSFWEDKDVWLRASKNTLNCLIGCSIGDFGMIVYLQTYQPLVNMYLMMALAMLTGLATSVALETILLKVNERFDWATALKTAIGMSFLSMLAMELAENTTDLLLTGGQVATSEPFYWVALAISLSAGFLVPLPYNYYKLKKYAKACH